MMLFLLPPVQIYRHKKLKQFFHCFIELMCHTVVTRNDRDPAVGSLNMYNFLHFSLYNP